jgi:hypothetical protein
LSYAGYESLTTAQTDFINSNMISYIKWEKR